MSKLAVDIVLLLPVNMSEMAIELSRELAERHGSEIILGETGMLPHVSLCMGIMEEGHLTSITKVLNELAAKHLPIELELDRITVTALEDRHVSSLRLKRTNNLQALHEDIMDRFSPLLTHNALPSYFYGEEPIFEHSVDWVNGYPQQAAHERFDPHITLGIGTLQEKEIPEPFFTASRLALCHLGNYCTCRRVLAEAIV